MTVKGQGLGPGAVGSLVIMIPGGFETFGMSLPRQSGLSSESEYLQPTAGLWIKAAASERLSRIDGLVLDIDGVVIDVKESFRAAIGRTVQFLFSEILGFAGDVELVTAEETGAFKMAGGFNNDWDLTSAVSLFFLCKAQRLGTQRLDTLRQGVPSLESFAAEVKEGGGGPQVAKDLALRIATDRRLALKTWEPKMIRRVFMEIYGGADYCRRLYGFDPDYYQGTGLVNEEKVMVDAERVAAFLPRAGILTGRTKEETEAALAVAGLENIILMSNIVYDDGELRKPDPKTLMILKQRLGAQSILYIGDTPDDLETVVRARRIEDSFLSGIVVSNNDDRESFFDLGADLVTLGVNEALAWVDSVREG